MKFAQLVFALLVCLAVAAASEEKDAKRWYVDWICRGKADPLVETTFDVKAHHKLHFTVIGFKLSTSLPKYLKPGECHCGTPGIWREIYPAGKGKSVKHNVFTAQYYLTKKWSFRYFMKSRKLSSHDRPVQQYKKPPSGSFDFPFTWMNMFKNPKALFGFKAWYTKGDVPGSWYIFKKGNLIECEGCG